MKNKKILIVDDMDFDRKILSKIITKKLDCEVFESQNHPDTISILEKEEINLVLLDIGIPGSSGPEILIDIRKRFAIEDLPVIMVSGLSNDDIIVECLEKGANDYITKPINIPISTTRIIQQLNLSSAIKDKISAQELLAIKSLIVTYNHEINSPLAAALLYMDKLFIDRSNDETFNKIKGLLERISEKVKSIKNITEKSSIKFSDYSTGSKNIKLG